MLLYNSKSAEIFNLDNAVYIATECYDLEDELYRIILKDSNANKYQIVECESGEEAQKVLAKIYLNMTYGSGNMILNLEDFRKELRETETAKTRKALKCGTCIYVDTDGCKEWDNDGTGCDAHITEEEAKKDVNEEK